MNVIESLADIEKKILIRYYNSIIKIIVDNLSTIIFRMLIEYKIKYYAKQKYYN